MKFYLSSYKMGDKVREFQAMISGTNHKAAYIPNALDFATVVPHFRSDHHESELADKAAAYLAKNKIPFKTIRDGEVLIFEVL